MNVSRPIRAGFLLLTVELLAPSTALGAEVAPDMSQTGASVFILLVLFVGSVAAGLFFGLPLGRRRRRAQSDPQSWASSAAPSDPAPPHDLSPWSTSPPTDSRLQRRR